MLSELSKGWFWSGYGTSKSHFEVNEDALFLDIHYKSWVSIRCEGLHGMHLGLIQQDANVHLG